MNEELAWIDRYLLGEEKDEHGVWDLAGNVAEWAVTEDGKGKVMGFSAMSPTDKRCEYSPPPPGYVELRVISDK